MMFRDMLYGEVPTDSITATLFLSRISAFYGLKLIFMQHSWFRLHRFRLQMVRGQREHRPSARR